jgi:hypothetical protein
MIQTAKIGLGFERNGERALRDRRPRHIPQIFPGLGNHV